MAFRQQSSRCKDRSHLSSKILNILEKFWQFNSLFELIAFQNNYDLSLKANDIVWYPCLRHYVQYNDVIMGTMASQITSLTIAYSTVYSGADERKHRSSTSLASNAKKVSIWWRHHAININTSSYNLITGEVISIFLWQEILKPKFCNISKQFFF